MKKFKNIWVKYELKWYTGSLDFSCYFCDSNSYRNFHISMGDNIIVVCVECLKKAQQEKDT